MRIQKTSISAHWLNITEGLVFSKRIFKSGVNHEFCQCAHIRQGIPLRNLSIQEIEHNKYGKISANYFNSFPFIELMDAIFTISNQYCVSAIENFIQTWSKDVLYPKGDRTSMQQTRKETLFTAHCPYFRLDEVWWANIIISRWLTRKCHFDKGHPLLALAL